MQRLLKKMQKAQEYYRKHLNNNKEYYIRKLSIHGFTTIRGDLISNIELELLSSSPKSSPQSSLPSSPQSSPTTKNDDNYNEQKREKVRRITT